MSSRPIYRYNDLTPNATTKPREIGISVQFLENGIFQSTYTTKSQVKNQLINYILTNPGERFFDPAFGSGIRNLLFEQQQDFTSLEENLKDLIELKLSDCELNDITNLGILKNIITLLRLVICSKFGQI